MSANALAHEISKEDHHAFEHKYTEICTKRELKNSVNKEIDRKRVTGYCECMAKDLSKYLTLTEVKKFLRENKYPQSLIIRSDIAAYRCVQTKSQKQMGAPTIFKQR